MKTGVWAVPYLEKITACGLGKLNTILKTLRVLAAEQGLKPSLTVYKKWGKGKKIKLRFSKTGSLYMENNMPPTTAGQHLNVQP